MKLWFFFLTDATQVRTPKDTSLVDIHLAEDGEEKKKKCWEKWDTTADVIRSRWIHLSLCTDA